MIEINNLTNFSLNKKFFTGVAKKVLKGENKEMENLSIAFVSAKEIQKLNKKYRKKDEATDVLSFGKVPKLLAGMATKGLATSNFKGEFSEIVICPAFVRENLNGLETIFEKELAKVLIHGILHVLGYDHEISKSEEERMFKKQDYYLSKVK